MFNLSNFLGSLHYDTASFLIVLFANVRAYIISIKRVVLLLRLP